LANARTFGGENYFGFHVFMALAPAAQMAQSLPTDRAPLPLLKVLYRHAHYAQEMSGAALQPLEPAQSESTGAATAEALRAAVNRGDVRAAEALLAELSRRSPEDALNAALLGVQDNHEVHSVVLPWRAWAMLDFLGREQALTLLRQSIRKCAQQSRQQAANHPDLQARARARVPQLVEKHQLGDKTAAPRSADDAWISRFSDELLGASADAAGEQVALALAEGFLPEHIGEAISLAASELVLRQVANAQGSYRLGRRSHGDAPGVHAADTVNAWRNLARVCNDRNRMAGLILAGINVASSYHQGGQPQDRLHEQQCFLRSEDRAQAAKVAAAQLPEELRTAIEDNDQQRATALVEWAGQQGLEAVPLFNQFLRYAVSEDGRLHAEKYFLTVVEEFRATRPSLRWKHLMALARVTASCYGMSQQDRKEGRAPGYEEACQLLKVPV
ncbi:MAG TPA: hypothetical protein PKC45_15435, partial [Gemmatales bacterium]|nr:hypothetical protein [Gemmatales bacterium]